MPKPNSSTNADRFVKPAGTTPATFINDAFKVLEEALRGHPRFKVWRTDRPVEPGVSLICPGQDRNAVLVGVPHPDDPDRLLGDTPVLELRLERGNNPQVMCNFNRGHGHGSTGFWCFGNKDLIGRVKDEYVPKILEM